MSHAQAPGHEGHYETQETSQPLHDHHPDASHEASQIIPLRRRITNGVLCLGAAAAALYAMENYLSDQESVPSLLAGLTIGASIGIMGFIAPQPIRKLIARRRERGRWEVGPDERDIITPATHDIAHSSIAGSGYLVHALGGVTEADQLLAFTLSIVGAQMFWPSTNNLRHSHSHSTDEHAGSPLVSKRRARLLAGLNTLIGGAGLCFGVDVEGGGAHSSAAAVAEGMHNAGDGVYAFQGGEHHSQAHAHEHHVRKKSFAERLRAPIVRQIGVAALAAAALVSAQELLPDSQASREQLPAAQQPQQPDAAKNPPARTAKGTKAKTPGIPQVTVRPGWGLYDIYAALNIPPKKRHKVLEASQKVLRQTDFAYQTSDGLRITRTGKVPKHIIRYTLEVARTV